MKKLSILITVIALFGVAVIRAGKPATPVEKGIHFENITFNQALQEAKREHKLVVMNVYATWRVPCKMMMKNTLTNEKVGSVFNKDFVNISVNAEKGEGIELVKRYQISGHPIMLVINSQGKMVKRILGYMDSDQLLAQVKGLTK
ncbi:MAG TPA: thioredoxin fold domain-containing protein [Hanamia sp.]|nr:thioredoxin fold domain-containing protein [Hanamia sp.]